MRSSRLLKEIFVSEATLEFPDGEIDAVNRVLAGAARRGAIPRDAVENWPILKSSDRPVSKPTPAKPKTRDAKEPSGSGSKASAPTTEPPSKRTGRVIPATNRFRQKEPESEPGSREAPSKGTKKASASGPGVLKRAVSAVSGKDPETGLPKARPANVKVKSGRATSLPDLTKFFPNRQRAAVKANDDGSEDDPLAAFPNKQPEPSGDPDLDSDERGYVSPFSGIPGMGSDDSDDESDPKIAAIKHGFKKAKSGAAAAPAKATKYPEADIWDRFGGKGDTKEPPRGKQQGRLSRLFKGRRDDDI